MTQEQVNLLSQYLQQPSESQASQAHLEEIRLKLLGTGFDQPRDSFSKTNDSFDDKK